MICLVTTIFKYHFTKNCCWGNVLEQAEYAKIHYISTAYIDYLFNGTIEKKTNIVLRFGLLSSDNISEVPIAFNLMSKKRES